MAEKLIETHNLETIILCGGLGSRLGSLTNNVQKCMLEINGVPFIYYVVEQLRTFGIQKFIFATGKSSEDIEEKFSDIGIISKEEVPLGTGGAIKNALCHIENDHCMVVNGDSFCDLTLEDFTDFINSYSGNPTILLSEIRNSSLASLFATPHDNYYGAGFYLFPKKVFKDIPKACSLEHDCLPAFPNKKYYRVADCSVIDIGTLENFQMAQLVMKI